MYILIKMGSYNSFINAIHKTAHYTKGALGSLWNRHQYFEVNKKIPTNPASASDGNALAPEPTQRVPQSTESLRQWEQNKPTHFQTCVFVFFLAINREERCCQAKNWKKYLNE